MITIYKNFIALSEEKRTRILNAALHEFGLYGYKKTSMEQLANYAEISKGMIFHYFGTKKGLFDYLVQFSTDYMLKYFDDLGDKLFEMDYVERISLATKIKMQAYLHNPYVFEFTTRLYVKPDELKASKKAQEVYNNMMNARDELFAKVFEINDTKGLLRTDIEETKIAEYSSWIINGYADKIIRFMQDKALAEVDLGPFWEEFDKILDDIRVLFYRNMED